VVKAANVVKVESGKVYCPICTHTVDAQVQHADRRTFVTPGQKCPRCRGSLDAGYIFKRAA
jgi:hypothetical protein